MCYALKTHIFITPDTTINKSVLLTNNCLRCLSLFFEGINRGRHGLKVIFELSEKTAQLALPTGLRLNLFIVRIIDLTWRALWCHREYRFGTLFRFFIIVLAEFDVILWSYKSGSLLLISILRCKFWINISHCNR